GVGKDNVVWRPTEKDINSVAFNVIVGKPKYTPGGLPKGVIYDSATNGPLEIKSGASMLDSSYQLRLMTYRALRDVQQLTIRTRARTLHPRIGRRYRSGSALMSLYLCIFRGDEEIEGVEVGSYADFGRFRDTVAEKLEDGRQGSRFPLLQLHPDSEGEWDPD